MTRHYKDDAVDPVIVLSISSCGGCVAQLMFSSCMIGKVNVSRISGPHCPGLRVVYVVLDIEETPSTLHQLLRVLGRNGAAKVPNGGIGWSSIKCRNSSPSTCRFIKSTVCS